MCSNDRVAVNNPCAVVLVSLSQVHFSLCLFSKFSKNYSHNCCSQLLLLIYSKLTIKKNLQAVNLLQ